MSDFESLKKRAQKELYKLIQRLTVCNEKILAATMDRELNKIMWDVMFITDEEVCFKTFREIRDDTEKD